MVDIKLQSGLNLQVKEEEGFIVLNVYCPRCEKVVSHKIPNYCSGWGSPVGEPTHKLEAYAEH